MEAADLLVSKFDMNKSGCSFRGCDTTPIKNVSFRELNMKTRNVTEIGSVKLCEEHALKIVPFVRELNSRTGGGFKVIQHESKPI